MDGGWNEKRKADTLNTVLHDEMKIKSPEDRYGYKYLGIIQWEKKIKNACITEKVTKYFRRLNKISGST